MRRTYDHKMRSTLRCMCVLFFFLGPWLVWPIFAEVRQHDSTTQESTQKHSGQSKPPSKRLYRKPVPFAHFEESLKNSEQWKTMSPEEQNEALKKISEARERFRKNEIERQKQLLPLLKKKPIRRPRPLPEPDQIPEAPIEDIR